MTLTQQRREFIESTVARLVALFDESGTEYTCRNAIIFVIEHDAISACIARPDLGIRARLIVNLVCDAIHYRKYPEQRK